MINLRVSKHLLGSDGPFELSIAFTIPTGEMAVLYGVSGAGKTTLLRMLAGLEHPDDGSVAVDEETWFDREQGVCVPPQKRSVGLVFQNYALFPSMTVRRNLEFAAGRRKDPRVDMLLEMVELEELQYRRPEELSGGQQQRVALARALIRQPKILLLDEPLSALDEEIRHKLQEKILRLHKELGLTSILVSHDRLEIMRMADRVLTIHEGRLMFEGAPSDAFANDLTCCSRPLQAEIVSMCSENGAVGIIAATRIGGIRIELQVDELEIRQLLDNGVAPLSSVRGNSF